MTDQCADCHGSGILTWQDGEARHWSPCGCQAGDALSGAIAQGGKDIRAGRLHKWSDVRREAHERRGRPS